MQDRQPLDYSKAASALAASSRPTPTVRLPRPSVPFKLLPGAFIDNYCPVFTPGKILSPRLILAGNKISTAYSCASAVRFNASFKKVPSFSKKIRPEPFFFFNSNFKFSFDKNFVCAEGNNKEEYKLLLFAEILFFQSCAIAIFSANFSSSRFTLYLVYASLVTESY